MADNLEFGIDLRFDIAAIAQATTQMAAHLSRMVEANQNVAQSFDRVTASAKKTTKVGADMADGFARASKTGSSLAEELARDLEAVTTTARATRATLESVGADPKLFAVAELELKRVLQLQSRFRDEFERIGESMDLRPFVQEFEQIRTPLAKSFSNLNELLRSTARERGQIQQRETLQLREELKKQEDARRAARGIAVAETQRDGAIRKASIRADGQLLLQTERATARTRIEILRFTLNQVRTFERAIGAVARGTAVIVAGAYARIEGAVGRLGQVFRRSNRSIDDGLQGALTSRERAIRSSFQRQTNDVRASINQQSAQLDRLDRQMSTGVLGALTGRSRIGGALGAGALIGGGLTASNLFTSGLDRFQSLEKANLQLERMLGSAQAARRQLDSLTEWAQGTPLALDTVTEMAVGLLSMGVAADEVLPSLTAIADAVGFTGGGAQQIDRIGLALRQIASTGKLQGDEFNQLAESLPGLNINQLLADQLTGGDTAALLKLRESGKLSADEFLKAFIGGIEDDPRVAGSIEAMAGTLQGQISNLNAAWRRLGAAIITEFEGPIRASIRRLRDNLSFLAKFVAGDVSDGLQTLRGALLGVGGALGVLVGARAGVQVIQLLGIAIQFALTPMGAFVTAIVAIGAAIGALRTTSDTFRYITDGIAGLVPEAAAAGLRLLKGLLVDLVFAVADLVEPFARGGAALTGIVSPVEIIVAALRRLADIVLSGLLVAFRVLVAVFNAVLIPAFKAAFGYFVNTAIPAALDLASAISGYLLPAALALAGAWLVFNAPLSVVVAGLAAVSAALVILRSESTTVRNFTDGLADSFVNLGKKLGSIGSAAASAALDVLRALGDTLGDLFSRIDYQALAVDVLQFVNEVGRLLGDAITSRMAVTAAIAIGVAAVALAGAFLTGFAEGVIKGLPGAIDTILDAIRLGLTELGAPSFFTDLFKNSFTGIGVLIVAALLAGSVLARVSAAGAQVAKAFSKGFVPGIQTSVRSGIGGARGLFGGSGALEAAATKEGAKARRALVREAQRANRELQALGQKVTFLIPKGGFDEKAVKELNKRLADTKARLGEAGSAAVLFRSRTSQAFQGLGEVMRAPFTAFNSGLREAEVQARVGGIRIRQALGDSIAAAGGFRAVGQRAGVTLLSGFSAALAGGQGGKSGLIGVVAASLGALAIGGPLVAGITALVGGATLLWTELNKSDETLKRMEETANAIRENLIGLSADQQVEFLADTLGTEIRENVANFGFTAGFDLIAEAERGIRGGAPNLASTLDQVFGNLNLKTPNQEPIFGSDLIDQLKAVELGEQALLNLSEAYRTVSQRAGERASGSFTDAELEFLATVSRVNEALGAQGAGLDDLSRFLGVLTGGVGAYAVAAEEARIASSWVTTLPEDVAAAARGLESISGYFGAAAERAQLAATEVSGFQRLLQFEAVSGAVQRVTGLIDQFGATGVNVFEAVQEELKRTGVEIDDGLIPIIRDLIDEWIYAGKKGDEIRRLLRFDERAAANWRATGDGIKRVGQELIKIEPPAQEATKSIDLLGAAIQEIKSQRTTALRAEIEGVRSRLDEATKAAEEARAALTAFITGRYADTAQAQVDNLIGSLGNIGSAIEGALVQGGVRGEAALRSAVGGFESQLAGIIQAGFDDGLRTQEQFRNLLAPLFAAVDEETGDAASRILSNVDFEAGFSPQAAAQLSQALDRVLGGDRLEVGVQGILDAEANQRAIQNQLDQLQNSLDVDVAISPAQVRQALIDAFNQAGVPLSLVPNVDGAAIAAATQTGLVGAAAQYGDQTVNATTTIPVTMNINGQTQPVETAAEVNARLNAMVAGITITSGIGYSVPVRPRTNVVTQS